jgi:hypothetical protein
MRGLLSSYVCAEVDMVINCLVLVGRMSRPHQALFFTDRRVVNLAQ